MRAGEADGGRGGVGAPHSYELIVLLFAILVFFGGVLSPPSLMDDVDSVQAQIARTMLHSGDWVTCRLDGVAYLEKAPGPYWAMAASYAVFGVHDWAARIPFALSAVLLCWVVARWAAWAFSAAAGLYAGLALSTCVGLFLFTRIEIPDVTLTLAITLAIWSFIRALDAGEAHPRLWAAVLAASLACAVLLKGLIGVVFPAGAAFIFLAATRQLFARATWRRLHVVSGASIFLLIAAPWHVLAALRNPPYFDFTLTSAPRAYHGFLWFYFINEHLLRFLNLRYPRDYNTVPRHLFWLLHLVWFFPWSVYLHRLARLSYRPADRAGKTRMMALCWAGVVMIFFTFSTTQEYYSMPAYPAVALLLGCALAAGEERLRGPARFVAGIAAVAGLGCAAILFLVRGLPAPGDISWALTQNPDLYTLSLGHMTDLTLRAFAYLRLPLALAALAFLAGAAGAFLLRGRRAVYALAAMMVLFFQAARIALIAFDPYLSSRPLAEALNKAPRGRLIVDDQYYSFSSVFFYTNYTHALLLNGRVNNLEYGSNAPDAPAVFLTDPDLPPLWLQPRRSYLVLDGKALPRIEKLVGAAHLHQIASAGGKLLVTNGAGGR
ncbi:MAG TPA: glycosyltransferase family 39 protein [Bryobacteraceae bacterium]